MSTSADNRPVSTLAERLGERAPRVLLVLPPLTQLNTPYPSTAYLAGFLRSEGLEVAQVDLGLELVLALFSREGLGAMFDAIAARLDEGAELPDEVETAFDHRARYLRTIDPVIRFLQGRDETLASRIASRSFLPEGPRFASLGADELAERFGELGVRDAARYVATRYLDDLADLVRATVSEHFAFTRYAERLAAAAPSYDPLADALAEAPNLVDRLLLERFDAAMEAHAPDIVGFSAPFPGNLYGALRCGQHAAARYPQVTRLLGGGYPNTELRELSEPRLFACVDYVTLDDGERPLVCLLEHLGGLRERRALRRTFALALEAEGDTRRVEYLDGASEGDVRHAALPAPSYQGLRLGEYLDVLSVPNPMHRLWNDGRWNKLTVAHGCYWKRCTFCDVTLDYIARYEPAPAQRFVDHMETLIAETGQTGFHFVDEAAPPAVLRDIALEILARGLVVSWWTNIRFEKRFTRDLCRLLAASGCIAVTGGLEVASPRLLARIDKGVTIEQVARVAKDFADAGILVHAYLMYGFPTQTVQETVDSLDVVRQLFAAGAVHSAFWHRFAMTVHSPVGKDPEGFGAVASHPPTSAFARNDVVHEDPEGADHDALGPGLEAALYNYLHGVGLERSAASWFDRAGGGAPQADVDPALVELALLQPPLADGAQLRARVVWLGEEPHALETPEGEPAGLLVPSMEGGEVVEIAGAAATWSAALLDAATPRVAEEGEVVCPRLGEAIRDFPDGPAALGAWLESPGWQALRQLGLLLV